MKRRSKSEQISDLARHLECEIRHWQFMKIEGCQDPFWPDGVNMNLTRNHVISYKREIAQLCTETGEPLPQAYYLPTPPKVPDAYMARLDTPRARRVIAMHLVNQS